MSDEASKEQTNKVGSAPVRTAATTDLKAPDLAVDDPDMYAYDASSAPDDVVINAGKQPVILGSEAVLGSASPRMDPGERRRGRYYTETIMPRISQIQLVKNVPQKRLNELEKTRLQAIGKVAPDWVVRARERDEREDRHDMSIEDAARRLREAAVGRA